MKYSNPVRKDAINKGYNYNVSYRSYTPRKGGSACRLIYFSSSYMHSRGWEKGDRIKIVFCDDITAVGFKRVQSHEESDTVRSLTQDNSATKACHLKMVGDYNFPFIRERVELKILDDQTDGFTFAAPPGHNGETSQVESDSREPDPMTEQLDSIEAEPAKSQVEVDAEQAELMAKIAHL
jgi:hypothetical protein